MLDKSILINWLAEDELEKTLKGLKSLANKYEVEQLRSDIAFQSGRLKTLKEQRAKNIISFENDRIETARIRQALLQMSQEIPNEWSFEAIETLPDMVSKVYKINHRRNLQLIILFICILLGFSVFLKREFRDFFYKKQNFEDPSKIDTVSPKVSTTGENSPIVITREGDVNINYSTSNAKKDSASKK